MKKQRGFITVATGKYFCRLAQNLAMSYRLFSKGDYPLCALTDRDGEKRLKKYFDDIVVLEKPTFTFMDKMDVYRLSPFEETIFLDADMNITRDIGFLFDEFEKTGSPVSCIGSIREITDDARPIHFGDVAVGEYGLKSFVAFNGGIYYYKRCEEADAFFKFMFDELVPNYHRLGLKVFREGQLADEPLIGLAMAAKGFKPLDVATDIMKYVNGPMDTFKWDIREGKCTFVRAEGVRVNPIIPHYGTHNTYSKKYVYYNTVVRSKYRGLFPPLIPFYVFGCEVRLLFAHLSRERDRRAFASWVKAHFTKAYYVNLIKRIKSLFGR